MTTILSNEDVIRSFRAELDALPVAQEPRRPGRRVLLAPGVWIVRAARWLPVSILDVASQMPDQALELRHAIAPPVEWHDRAACRGMGWERFFGEDNPVKQPALPMTVLNKTRRVCGGCEVAEDCLLWALRHRESHGVWAGTTGKQRKAVFRELDALPRAAQSEAIKELVGKWLGKNPTTRLSLA